MIVVHARARRRSTVVSPQTTSTRCTRGAELARWSASADGFGVAAAMRDVARRRRRGALGGSALPATTGVNGVAHRPDRVWWTELPNGSESSSITDGGM